ncbi:MAG TPA: lysylphosphatidylglycerol synthase transmembrane domain-containing protein [Rubrobacteraceae bacterium]|nr:lysylphosphatidylglycerol synthase transmembrane domain-containing protein [Rubrobacteraceae bacterium]
MRRLGRNLALALALGAAVYLVLAVLSDFGNVAGALENFNYALLPAILGLVSLSYVGRFLRWVYYLEVLKVSVPTGMNAAIFAAGLSMTISPGKLGEVLKCVFVRQVSGAAISRTAPAVVAERITDGTGVVAWGLLGAMVFSFGPGMLLAFLAVAALGIAVLRSKRLSLVAERALLKVPLLNRLAPAVHEFHASSNELLSTRPLVVGTVISFLSWGLEILAVYLCAVGIGAQLPFLVVVFVFAAGSLVGVGSMLPGGIGAAEASMAGMFKFYAGLPAGLAVALTFVIRLVTLWFATLVGVVGLFVVRHLLGDAALETDP